MEDQQVQVSVDDSTTDEIREIKYHWYKNYSDSNRSGEEQNEVVEDFPSQREPKLNTNFNKKSHKKWDNYTRNPYFKQNCGTFSYSAGRRIQHGGWTLI